MAIRYADYLRPEEEPEFTAPFLPAGPPSETNSLDADIAASIQAMPQTKEEAQLQQLEAHRADLRRKEEERRKQFEATAQIGLEEDAEYNEYRRLHNLKVKKLMDQGLFRSPEGGTMFPQTIDPETGEWVRQTPLTKDQWRRKKTGADETLLTVLGDIQAPLERPLDLALRGAGRIVSAVKGEEPESLLTGTPLAEMDYIRGGEASVAAEQDQLTRNALKKRDEGALLSPEEQSLVDFDDLNPIEKGWGTLKYLAQTEGSIPNLMEQSAGLLLPSALALKSVDAGLDLARSFAASRRLQIIEKYGKRLADMARKGEAPKEMAQELVKLEKKRKQAVKVLSRNPQTQAYAEMAGNLAKEAVVEGMSELVMGRRQGQTQQTALDAIVEEFMTEIGPAQAKTLVGGVKGAADAGPALSRPEAQELVEKTIPETATPEQIQKVIDVAKTPEGRVRAQQAYKDFKAQEAETLEAPDVRDGQAVVNWARNLQDQGKVPEGTAELVKDIADKAPAVFKNAKAQAVSEAKLREALPDDQDATYLGVYEDARDMVTLVTDISEGKGDATVAIHEFFHRGEKTLPPSMRIRIRKDHANALTRMSKKVPAAKPALDEFAAGNREAGVQKITDLYSEGKITREQANEALKLETASELWAHEATNFASSRHRANTVWKKAKQRFDEMGAKLKGMVTGDAKAGVLEALDYTFKSDGTVYSDRMMANVDVTKPAEPAKSRAEYPDKDVLKQKMAERKAKAEQQKLEAEEGKGISLEAQKEVMANPELIGDRMKDPTKSEWLSNRMVDALLPTKRIQKELGIKQFSDQDAYTSLRNLPGRRGKAYEDIQSDYVRPFQEALAKSDATLEELDFYLTALFTPLREKLGLPTGMDPVIAKKIVKESVDKYGARHLKELARHVWDMNSRKLQLQLASGRIDQQYFDNMMEKFGTTYVPTKGFLVESDKTAARKKARAMSKIRREGVGSDIQSIRQVMGRASLADSPSMQTIRDLEQAADALPTHDAMSELASVIENNPDPDFWEVVRVETPAERQYRSQKAQAVAEEAGLGRELEDVIRENEEFASGLLETTKENAVPFMRDGKRYEIRGNLSDPQASEFIRGLVRFSRNPDAAPALKAWSAAMRAKAAVSTTLNPFFTVRNLMRDYSGAMFNILAERGIFSKDAMKIVGKTNGYLPSALKDLWRGEFTGKKGGSKMAEFREEWEQAGGRIIGFRGKDLEGLKKSTKEEIQRLKGKGNKGLVALGRNYMKVMEKLNAGVENAVRLSYYRALRESGIPVKEAAFEARRLTIDFDAKGQWGRAITNYKLFANASIQGSREMTRAFRSSDPAVRRRAYGLAGAMGVGGFLLAMANRMLMGENEDSGRNRWDEVPDYMKRNNVIFGIPEEGGVGVKAPLQYGYGSFWNTGTMLADYLLSDDADKMETPEFILQVLQGAVDAVDFTGGGLADFTSFFEAGADTDALSTAMIKQMAPTLLMPFAEISANRDFAGRPIWVNTYDKTKAQSAYTGPRTWKTYKDFFKNMNERFGGSDAKPSGFLTDWSPAQAQHWTEFLIGGLGYSAIGTSDAIQNWISAEGDPVAQREAFMKSPLGKLFVVTPSNYGHMNAAYGSSAVEREQTYKHINDMRDEAADIAKQGSIELQVLHDEITQLNKQMDEALKKGSELKRSGEIQDETKFNKLLEGHQRKIDKKFEAFAAEAEKVIRKQIEQGKGPIDFDKLMYRMDESQSMYNPETLFDMEMYALRREIMRLRSRRRRGLWVDPEKEGYDFQNLSKIYQEVARAMRKIRKQGRQVSLLTYQTLMDNAKDKYLDVEVPDTPDLTESFDRTSEEKRLSQILEEKKPKKRRRRRRRKKKARIRKKDLPKFTPSKPDEDGWY